MVDYYKRLKNGKPAVGYYLRLFKDKYQNKFLPPVTYYSVDEYIHFHHNKKKWIKYCEVLVNKHGDVAWAVPSHQEAVYGGDIVTKAKYLYKTTPSEYCMEKLCDDFNVIMIWYDYCLYGYKQPTVQQVTTLYKLFLAKCISYDCFKQFTLRLKGVYL